MHFCIARRASGALAFQLLRDDGSVALHGVTQGDVDACTQAIREVFTSLREGVGVVRTSKPDHRFSLTGELGTVLVESVACPTAADADALLAELQRWAAGEVRVRMTFPPEQRVAHANTEIGVAIRYDLEQPSSSGRPGVELLRRDRDRLLSAHFNDADGRPLLYLRGFTGRHARDEAVRALLQAMTDARRYRRQDGDGRVYFVVTARNNRELARSRWFTGWPECEAAIHRLVAVAAEELGDFADDVPAARRPAAIDYQLDRASATGAAGFESYAVGRRHYFTLNGDGGQALLFSHGYVSARERDAGIAAVIRVAMLRDHYQRRVDQPPYHFVLLARNNRELARSRDFASVDDVDAAIRWMLRDITIHGAGAGVQRPETMYMAVSDDGAVLPAAVRPRVPEAPRAEPPSAADLDPASPPPATHEPTASPSARREPATPAPAKREPTTPAPAKHEPSARREPSTPAPAHREPTSPPATREPTSPAPTNLAPSSADHEPSSAEPPPVRLDPGASGRFSRQAADLEPASGEPPPVRLDPGASGRFSRQAADLEPSSGEPPPVRLDPGASGRFSRQAIIPGRVEALLADLRTTTPPSARAASTTTSADPVEPATAEPATSAEPSQPDSTRRPAPAAARPPDPAPAPLVQPSPAPTSSPPTSARPHDPATSPSPAARDLSPTTPQPAPQPAAAAAPQSPPPSQPAAQTAAATAPQPTHAAQTSVSPAPPTQPASSTQPPVSTAPQSSRPLPPVASTAPVTRLAPPVVASTPILRPAAPVASTSSSPAAPSQLPPPSRPVEPRPPPAGSPASPTQPATSPHAPEPEHRSAATATDLSRSRSLSIPRDEHASASRPEPRPAPDADLSRSSRAIHLQRSDAARSEPRSAADTAADLSRSSRSISPPRSEPRSAADTAADLSRSRSISPPRSEPRSAADTASDLSRSSRSLSPQRSEPRSAEPAADLSRSSRSLSPQRSEPRSAADTAADLSRSSRSLSPQRSEPRSAEPAADLSRSSRSLSPPRSEPRSAADTGADISRPSRSSRSEPRFAAESATDLSSSSRSFHLQRPGDSAAARVDLSQSSRSIGLESSQSSVPVARPEPRSVPIPGALPRSASTGTPDRSAVPVARVEPRSVPVVASSGEPADAAVRRSGPRPEEQPPTPVHVPRPDSRQAAAPVPPDPSRATIPVIDPADLLPSRSAIAAAARTAALPLTIIPAAIRPGTRGLQLGLLGLVALLFIVLVALPCSPRPQPEAEAEAGDLVADTAAPQRAADLTTPLVCPADDAVDPAVGILVGPVHPVAGEPLTILAATLADEAPLALQLIGADIEPTHLAGLPSIARATVTLTAGDYTAIVGRAGRGLRCQDFTVAVTPPPRRPPPAGDVPWPVARTWTPGEEALYSAWIRTLFAAPPADDLTFTRLDAVTRDPRRNFLHDALGWHEDGDDGLQLRPTGPALAYTLRAYYAWKRGLPFAFHACARGQSRCALRSNLTPDPSARATALDQVQDFFERSLGQSALDLGDDLYPVILGRRALRPGTLYADPYGQLLMIAEHHRAGDGPGLLLAVDARPDGGVARTRSGPGTLLHAAGAGFRNFRPVVVRASVAAQLTDDLIAAAPGSDLEPTPPDLTAAEFHDRLAVLVDSGPRDPFLVQRDLIAVLDALVRARVDLVARAAPHFREHRGVLDMPRDVFAAQGAWSELAAADRDLRLLAVIDTLHSFPQRVRSDPAAWTAASGLAGEAMLERLADDQTHLLADPEHRFEYRRSDGSTWTLNLVDIVARAPALEAAYNPNDCPEVRWGAPSGSDEAATCTRRAPAEQQSRMTANRRWFRERTLPRRE